MSGSRPARFAALRAFLRSGSGVRAIRPHTPHGHSPRSLAGRCSVPESVDAFVRSLMERPGRSTSGTLFPESYSEVRNGSERSGLRAELLLLPYPGARVRVGLRYLQLSATQPDGWHLAADRSALLGDWRIADLTGGRRAAPPIDPPIEARVRARNLGAAVRLTITVQNVSVLDREASREEALCRSHGAAHLLCTLVRGRFVSLSDPPPALADEAQTCVNEGGWPALIGDPDRSDLVLFSPFVHSDHPPG